MSVNFGDTLKLIRKSKNMTQLDVANNITTPAFISKIESNSSIPNAEMFYRILCRLHVSPEEFFVVNGIAYKNEDKYFFDNIDKLISSGNLYGLRNLHIEEDKKNCSDDDEKTRKFRKIILNISKSNLQGSGAQIQDVTPVFEYLINVESWGEYELLLYDHIQAALNTENLELLLHACMSKSNEYWLLDDSNQLMARLLLNTAKIFLLRESNEWAEKALASARPFTLKLDVSILSVEYNFLKGAILVKKGLDGRKIIRESIMVLEYFEDEFHVSQFIDYLKQLKLKY
ncbi:Rgg family transcriptional regulator [Lactiplantibacillus pentosus]